MTTPPQSPQQVISQARHCLGLAALDILADDPAHAAQRLQEAVRWAMLWQQNPDPALEDDYRLIVERGKLVRAALENFSPPLEDKDEDWQLTGDRLGATRRCGNVVYVVHYQSSRGAQTEWRWGVNDGNGVVWQDERYPSMDAAQDAAQDSMEQDSLEQDSLETETGAAPN